MTALQLLLWINAALAVQATLFGSIAFYRHWRSYGALRKRALEQGATEAELADPVPASSVSEPAWTGYREFVVQRKELEDPSGSVCSFYLVPADGRPLPPFRAGQFLTFRFDVSGGAVSNKAIVRCYSLSERSLPDHYRISVKRALAPARAPEALSGIASNYLHDHVRIGDRLSVRAPSGHFFLQEGTDPVVLIAGGIGITPMLSMLNTALQGAREREVWLFYGVRNGEDHAMKAHLNAMAQRHPSLHLRVCYSQPGANDAEGRDYHHRGHVDLALLRLTLPLRPFHFYVCGPRPLMESVVPALEDWGVPPGRIHYEAFGPASLGTRRREGGTGETEDKAMTVRFTQSGTEALWDPRATSLLEFAEGLGLKVESGCRAGSCGSCQVTLESGEVQYEQRPEFDPAPGDCLLCISRPRTNIVLRV